jgi:two-component system OmpR family sensor kinase
MNALPTRCRHLWMTLGLRGHLVAGYTALFAVLLFAIAIGETTVVRQVMIDDRKAALPGTANGLDAVVKRPASGQQIGLGFGGTPLVVAGNNDLIVAYFGANGSMLTRPIAGSDVQDVNPKQLLDTRQLAGASNEPSTYLRTIGSITYLVRVRSLSMMVQDRSGPAIGMPVPGAPSLGSITVSGSAPSDGTLLPGDGPVTSGSVGAKPVMQLVAESLRPVDETVNALLLVTLAASAIGLLLAAAAGLAVARRALRPLERMTATAQAIAAGGDGALDRRLLLPEHGDEVGRLATTFDHMLDRIQETIAERVRSETRLRHFAADASHELRTPLAALSGYTEVLLLGGKDEPKTAEHVLRQMDGELARMNRLVADLLTLARLEAGLPLHVQALPVAPLLEGLTEETRLLATRSRRDLVIVAGPPEEGAGDLAVLADPDRLHQILLNLLHNAVKFTPDGGRISVSAARQNGMVALSVADTGPGIAPAELPLLFERFYRSDRARARGDVEAGGAGLGLAIAQGLAQVQGGHIEVASAPGAGSTFTVVLPPACGVECGQTA